MGCSASKLDDEEAVQLCKDRKNFIKQVIEHRNRFASGHVAYVQSMRRVSLALLHYVVADDLHEFLSDSYTTPPFTPVKGLSPEVRAPLKFITPTSNETVKSSVRSVNFLRSGGNQSVLVEEWPEPHETVQLESYHPMENYGMDGFFASQSSPVNRSSFFSSPYNRSSYQSSSPQASRWDYFWNPFSSLDQYGYPSRSNFDRIVNDDDIVGLRQVREAEGIPELEEDIDDDDDHHDDHHDHDSGNAMFWKAEPKNKTAEVECKHTGVQVGDESPVSASVDVQKVQEVKEFKSKGPQSIEASEDQNAAELEIPNQHQVEGTSNAEETPGFTVYVNRRPGSMAEVMKDMENQFKRICDCAHEISVMLEASRAQYSSASNELAAVRMLNPVALFRSTSSCSSSSKFFQASSSSKGDADESSSDYSEECCMVSGSHKSTLDRLYAWEKKLYEEVKSGERVRIAYEKKCMQLRNHDINGDEPIVVDKTRASIRDLHTRLKISIHTVESISKRIEVLRDGELYPQLMEMIQGLFRMWKTMADCHVIQKRTIDEAKLLLFSHTAASVVATPSKLPHPASNLAAELRNWRSSFANWIDAQRSYVLALAGWASRCAPADTAEASGRRKAISPISQLRASGESGATTPEVVRVCVRWSRLVESVSEERAVDGMDFFAAGMASVSAQQREAEGEGTAAAAVEEVGPRVLCAGLSVAVGSLAEFAVVSAEGYDAVVRSEVVVDA